MLARITISSMIILALGAACSNSKNLDENATSSEKFENTMKGKIISQNFTNKGGKEISTIQDLYFETNDETYFIKFMDSNITFEQAKLLIDQPIEIEGEIRDGMWDVPDEDPGYAQSRTGYYLVIFSVK